MEGMLKDNALKGKTIIITGGGTGLGKSMGKYMLELGANLVISSRKEEVLVQTANELSRQTGGKVLPVVCDVRKYDEIQNVINKTESEFGQVHGVLNNAAGNFISPTERLSHRAFDIIVD
ncbi:MAG TPA: SDR family NAD(P)-dependent oxidoreductase, partial [Cyclobacteriaceae bacterium]|nr:SDR family NAD(P)-dependent oxidoreductase [Cyclobacteriaceae bacterium]